MDMEDSNTITDFNEKETDKEEEAGTSKRKYTRHKPLKGKPKRARKANLKNIPPELKLTEAENAGVVESQRRRRCQVCTKGEVFSKNSSKQNIVWPFWKKLFTILETFDWLIQLSCQSEVPQNSKKIGKRVKNLI